MAVTALIPRLKTPGVYIEEIPKLPPSIAQVETAIPAFIGYTEMAVDSRGQSLLLEPRRITSMLEYIRYFGNPFAETGIEVVITQRGDNFDINGRINNRSAFNMYYGLQMFFDNGGGPCWIVSVGTYTAADGTTVLPIELTELQKGLSVTEKINEITLYVFPDAQGLGSAVDYYKLYDGAIKMCVNLQDRFTIMDVWQDKTLPADEWTKDIKSLRDNTSAEINELKYVASYYPNLNTVLDLYYGGEGRGDEKVTIKYSGGSADYNDKSLAYLKSKNNALYFRARTAIRAIPCVMPPSPAMAGIYARVDAARGVWKAPANVNLSGVVAPSILLTDNDQGGLNVDVEFGKSINVIRFFTGRGIIVWGARTLAGNDNEWRYVPVRRFFNTIEESVKNATVQFVFEPNDRNTWTRVRSMIEIFLTLQWRAGALMGTTPEEAFYVRVGLNETMSEFDIFEGRMIVEIGMAVVRPAEFIILQFSHKMLSES